MRLATPGFLQPLLAQPVAIFGGGVSGEGVAALLAEAGVHGRIYDVNAGRGFEFTAATATQHRLVVFSPGFAPDHPWLQRAQAAGIPCLGELDFGSLFWQGKLVAITGTNGKTTLTEFLTHALRASGRAAHATGNIGHPLSRLAAEQQGGTKETFAICEVSSFQAEAFQHFRADSALWTNFAEDHLERHPGLAAYFAAKWKLVEHTDPGATWAGTSAVRQAEKFGFAAAALNAVSTEQQPADGRLAGTIFAEYPQRENFLLAAAWWRAQGLDEAELFAAARLFKLGRHRLTRVAEHEGVKFWNDSKATNFHAVEAALGGFRQPVVLIAGGKSKGGNIGEFVRRIAPRVKHMVLLGETSAELALRCAEASIACSCCAGLAEAVRRAAEIAERGEHVLLSPGFASFDLFRNYEDRGNQFEAQVQNLRASAAILG